MGYPRRYTVAPDQPGFYHCISRCVRRAWLCGNDPGSGRNFDHRRGWIEQRMLSLAESFAVGLYAWAVMSNHTHIVLRADPTLPAVWSDEDVARRWARLDRTLGEVPPHDVDQRVRRLLGQPERLETIRTRLGSVSWFMRFLNECIAREANAEDGCTGRFWEGRFRCQALLDDAAVAACMAYVDLNPIRAGIADDLDGSDFTSIQRRLRAIAGKPELGGGRLDAIAGLHAYWASSLRINEYVELVEHTRSLKHQENPGTIPPMAMRALAAIRGSPHWWIRCAHRIEGLFGRAVGNPLTLRRQAQASGLRCLKGAGIA